MFDTIIELIRSQLASNQFLAGGSVLMLLGAILAYLRNVPKLLWAFTKRQSLIVLDVTDEEPIFEWFKIWFDRHPSLKRSRLVTASYVWIKKDVIVSGESAESPRSSSSNNDDERQVVFSPAPGNHILFYKGRPALLNVSREKAEGGRGKRYLESFRLTIPGRSQAILRGLVEEAKSCALEDSGGPPPVFISVYGNWRVLAGYRHRSIKSVFLRAGEMEDLVEDIELFLSRREKYSEWGVPYHRGYLLSGLPGTGKTSTVSAVTGHLDIPLYVINLTGFGMDDERLMSLMFDVPPHSAVLLEDLDATAPTRDDKEKDGISLCGLLNCLDGIITQNGIIVFMTTNKRERLDAALLRPGRSDVEMTFDRADPEQIGRIYDYYTGEGQNHRKHFIAKHSSSNSTMAEVQAELMKQKEVI